MNRPALILVVEDNAGSQMLATVALEAEGFRVVGADSAEEARRMLRVEHPDLILMDIQLPGMDGVEFTRELKSEPKTARVPVVALSAHFVAGTTGEQTFDGFIPKPWTPEVLGREVRAHLSNAAETTA